MAVIRWLGLQVLDQRDVTMIELMVARHIDNQLVRETCLCPAQAFGKIMSELKSRHVGYDLWAWHDLNKPTLEAVRKTYDGPLTLASVMIV